MGEDGEGDLVGFITAHRNEVPPVYRAVSEIYISELYVRPEARRRGLGRRLVAAVRTWAVEREGAARLRLGVLARNAAGRAFWEAQEARPLAVTLTIELEEPAAREETSNRRRLGF